MPPERRDAIEARGFVSTGNPPPRAEEEDHMDLEEDATELEVLQARIHRCEVLVPLDSTNVDFSFTGGEGVAFRKATREHTTGRKAIERSATRVYSAVDDDDTPVPLALYTGCLMEKVHSMTSNTDEENRAIIEDIIEPMAKVCLVCLVSGCESTLFTQTVAPAILQLAEARSKCIRASRKRTRTVEKARRRVSRKRKEDQSRTLGSDGEYEFE